MSDRRGPRAPRGCLAVALAFGVPLGRCGMAAGPTAFGGHDRALPPAPPPAQFGTAREIGTRGDDPNPRAVYHGAFPSDDETQERTIDGAPARFSGYTTWIRSVSRVPARR